MEGGSQLDLGRVSGEWKSNQGEVVLQSTLNLSILLERSGPTSAGETVWPRAVRKQGIFMDCRVDRSRTFFVWVARKATSGDLSGDLNGEKCEAYVPV
jgi:hypothetical protein